jgi:hypothetical protein
MDAQEGAQKHVPDARALPRARAAHLCDVPQDLLHEHGAPHQQRRAREQHLRLEHRVQHRVHAP